MPEVSLKNLSSIVSEMLLIPLSQVYQVVATLTLNVDVINEYNDQNGEYYRKLLETAEDAIDMEELAPVHDLARLIVSFSRLNS